MLPKNARKPKPPAQLVTHAYQRSFIWCQRCIRAASNKSNSIDSIFRLGCHKGDNSRCGRCAEGRHYCKPVPPQLFRRCDQLIFAIQDFGTAQQSHTEKWIREESGSIGKAMTAEAKKSTTELPGLALPSTPARGARAAAASGPAGDGINGPLTEGTGRLLLGAVRTIAEIQAQAANIEPPGWPEYDGDVRSLYEPSSEEEEVEDPDDGETHDALTPEAGAAQGGGDDMDE